MNGKNSVQNDETVLSDRSDIDNVMAVELVMFFVNSTVLR